MLHAAHFLNKDRKTIGRGMFSVHRPSLCCLIDVHFGMPVLQYPQMCWTADGRHFIRSQNASLARVILVGRCAGAIPAELGQMSALIELHLNANKLTGELFFKLRCVL